MPHEDGCVLVERLRTIESGDQRRPGAIAVTAPSRPDSRLRALDAGFGWHLPKPIDPDELVAVVASLAGRARNLEPKPSNSR
jgi:CheY-like chemotaxis protein